MREDRYKIHVQNLKAYYGLKNVFAIVKLNQLYHVCGSCLYTSDQVEQHYRIKNGGETWLLPQTRACADAFLMH